MRNRIVVVPLLCLPLWTPAAETPPSPAPAPSPSSMQKAADTASSIVYRPPSRGAPAKRIGGSTRGISIVPVVTVLAPDHVALTSSEQPTLYWYLSAASSIRIEVARIDAAEAKPLIEVSYPSVEPGIHRFELRAFDIRLKPKEEYQWSVTSVVTEKDRSREIVSRSTFRLAETPAVRANNPASAKEQQAVAYAEEGLWHDALHALSEGITTAPERRDLRAMRADLLEQAGLRAAAAFDRRAAR
jgi:hypothetical protein